MRYGQKALSTRRHTVYISRKTYLLSKALAKSYGLSWSEYVNNVLGQAVDRDKRANGEKV
jgi:hypothetical protein